MTSPLSPTTPTLAPGMTNVGVGGDDSLPSAPEITDTRSIIVEPYPFARGAYADCYLAKWVPPGATQAIEVAVKILRLTGMNTTDEHVEALVRAGKHLGREVYVWQKMGHHPGIVPLLGYMRSFDGFVEADRPCLLSPYRSNGNLLIYMKQNPKADRLALLSQAAIALNYMHTLSPTPIAHLDIKPDNILIDDDGNAQLCDFGISRVLDDLPTGFTTSTGGGYLPFMSPELLMESTKSTAADVYAFGCVVLQTLTGRVPWWNKARGKLTILVSTGHAPERADYQIDAPEAALDEIWAMLAKCWAFDVTERLEMSEVVKRLEKIRSLMPTSVAL